MNLHCLILLTDSVARHQKSMVQQARQEVESLRQEKRKRELALKAAQQAVYQHNTEAKKLREASQRAEDRALQLDEEISQDNVNDTSVLEELRGQLEEAENDLQTTRDSYQDSVNQRDKIDALNKELRQQVDAVYSEVQAIETKIKRAQDRAQEREKSRYNSLLKKNHTLGLLDESRREKEEAVHARDVLAGQIRDDLTPQAEAVHTRVPVPQGTTTDMLDARMDKLVKEKRAFEQRYVPVELDCGPTWLTSTTGLAAAVRRLLSNGQTPKKISRRPITILTR